MSKASTSWFASTVSPFAAFTASTTHWYPIKYGCCATVAVILSSRIRSTFAQDALYWCSQYGQFICNQDYKIQRDYLDNYLLCYIKKGAMEVKNYQMAVTASEHSVVLMDCHRLSPAIYMMSGVKAQINIRIS